MKQTTEKITKVQFNARISPELKRAAKTVAANLDWSIEELSSIAIENLFGVAAPDKKKEVDRAVKSLHLSFRAPHRQPDEAELMAA